MKIIMIYSGKGGVGKTTTTANLARLAVQKEIKTCILDMDVNTPSMQIEFPEAETKNLKVISMGYTKNLNIHLSGATINAYLKDAKKQIQKDDPELVLLDTPPSLSDIHMKLVKQLTISGIIYVSQPTELSKADVIKTSLFFNKLNISPLGLIENMGNKDSANLDYGIKVIGHIPLGKKLETPKLTGKTKKEYEKALVLILNSEDVIQENLYKAYTDESITTVDHKQKTFINVKTWESVVDNLQSFRTDTDGMYAADKFLTYCTADSIKQMLDAFSDGTGEATFMVVRSPWDNVFPGEISSATLLLGKKSHYGVPRILFNSANNGQVTLFPHECKPLSIEEIKDLVSPETGHILTKGRYVPAYPTLSLIYTTLGKNAGIGPQWELQYLRHQGDPEIRYKLIRLEEIEEELTKVVKAITNYAKMKKYDLVLYKKMLKELAKSQDQKLLLKKERKKLKKEVDKYIENIRLKYVTDEQN